jgi:hypothetical protein
MHIEPMQETVFNLGPTLQPLPGCKSLAVRALVPSGAEEVSGGRPGSATPSGAPEQALAA